MSSYTILSFMLLGCCLSVHCSKLQTPGYIADRPYHTALNHYNNQPLTKFTLIYQYNRINYTVDFQLNVALISGTFSEQHIFGKTITKATTVPTLCQFFGTIEGMPNSWAIISLCENLRGIIYDGTQVLQLQKQLTHTDLLLIGSTVLFIQDPNQLTFNGHNRKCSHDPTFITYPPALHSYKAYHSRIRRDNVNIQNPIIASSVPRIVEVLLVIDYSLYRQLILNRRTVSQHCLHLIHLVNALYIPLNISIVLIGVIVWSTHNQIYIDGDSQRVLDDFLRYRRESLVKAFPHDHAQLLTATPFKRGVVGKAYPYSMCTYEHSGAIIYDELFNEELTAVTMAHELAHTFGMEHDANCCQYDHGCIMAPSLGTEMPTHWSPCNIHELRESLDHHIDFCLHNRPVTIYLNPDCGNGFVESGEQCDISNTCCNFSTCSLYNNASCATGSCCDTTTCSLKPKGTLCRPVVSECDLPDFCDGISEYCPLDIYKQDGTPCKHGQAFCYQNSCPTHSEQCQTLWGNTAKSMDDYCYENNDRGSLNGNCGYDHSNKQYLRCNKQDLRCGSLQCTHQSNQLKFGMHRYARIGNTINHSTYGKCSTVIVDLGLNVPQPGLVPNGAKCGRNRLCINQMCVSIDTIVNQTCHCNGHGICTNQNRCYCDIGYRAPLCTRIFRKKTVKKTVPRRPAPVTTTEKIHSIIDKNAVHTTRGNVQSKVHFNPTTEKANFFITTQNTGPAIKHNLLVINPIDLIRIHAILKILLYTITLGIFPICSIVFIIYLSMVRKRAQRPVSLSMTHLTTCNTGQLPNNHISPRSRAPPPPPLPPRYR